MLEKEPLFEIPTQRSSVPHEHFNVNMVFQVSFKVLGFIENLFRFDLTLRSDLYFSKVNISCCSVHRCEDTNLTVPMKRRMMLLKISHLYK